MILSGAHSDHQMTQEPVAATYAVDRVRIGELAPPTEHRSTRQNHGTVLATKAQNGTSGVIAGTHHFK
jgi:beta-lactamase superfamily II metal-dependent hydrolase